MKAVEAAFASLRFADREVLWLIAHDALSPEDAAHVLGVSVATLRVRLHRARRSLGRALNNKHQAHLSMVLTPQEEPSI